MKKILFLLIAAFLPFVTSAQSGTDSTGYAGDHFSLEGAIDLFKQAKSPEAFEKMLNDEKKNVNNLDLNEDGDVDYIRVIDNMDGDAHAIILQVPISENEAQDVAVIEIEKTGPESAILQIIGNEDVFGEEVIAEPFEEETKGSKNRGPNGDEYYTARIVVNVWFYPCVRYIYTPGYIVWVSPWRWMVYPRWWRPWRPLAWYSFHRHTLIWRPHYHRVKTHRVVNAHKVYAPRRTSSVTVKKRTTIIRTNNVTRKTTTVGVRKDGKSVVAGKKTTTRTAKANQSKAAVGKKITKTAVKKEGDKVVAGRKTTKAGVKKEGKNVTVKKTTTKAGVKKTPRGAKATKKTTTTKARKKGTASGVKKTTKTTKARKKKG
jgi:hypothetical protein